MSASKVYQSAPLKPTPKVGKRIDKKRHKKFQ